MISFRKYSTMMLCLFLIAVSFSQILAVENINFTEKEKAWIKSHPVIRARVGSAPPLHFFDGEFQGISVDYLNLISKRAGFKVEYKTEIPWSQALQNIKEGKNIDLILTAKATAERQKHMNFTKDYLLMPYVIFNRQDSGKIESIHHLKNKVVSVERNYVIHKKLTREYPNIKLLVQESSEEALKAVAVGQADAYIGNLTTATYIIQDRNLSNLKVAAPTPFDNHNQAMAIRKDWPELAQIIDKTFAKITSAEHLEIKKRWSFSNRLENVETLPQLSSTASIELNPKEQAWLKKHPKIRVINDKNFPPYDFYQNGKANGFSVEYLELLAEISGFQIEWDSRDDWDAAVNDFKNKKADLLHSVRITPERKKFSLFTTPYFRNLTGLFAQSDSRTFQSKDDLERATVAIPKGYADIEYIQTKYPKSKIIETESSKDALKMVALGKADVTPLDIGVGNYLIFELGIGNLVVADQLFMSKTNSADEFFMGVRDDWPELLSILNKAMKEVDVSKVQTLKQKWLLGNESTKTDITVNKTDKTNIWKVMGYGVFIFMFFSLLTWGLTRLLKNRNISIQYGSIWFRSFILAGLSLFLVIVFSIGWMNLERSRQIHVEDESQMLTGVLSIFQDRLDLWMVERKSFMKQLGRNPELVKLTKRLLKVSPEKRSLLASKELKNIRSFFNKNDDIFPNLGFFIIDPSYLSIGSKRNINIGTPNLILKEHPEILKNAFQGKVGFVPPMPSDVHLTQVGEEHASRKPSTMFFIAPIRDTDGHIIAVFTLRVAPWNDFSKLIKSFETLKSANIYAFDKKGRLLTPLRFDKHLQYIGLLSKGQRSALNLEIRDPGGNLLKGYQPKQARSKQPFTHLVSRTLILKKRMDQLEGSQNHSKIETDSIGYRDYRGVPVFGAWLWNHHLQVGLAAEIDLEEALRDYKATRFMVIGILGLTLFLSIGAVLFVLILGERASRELSKARDNLEDKVTERTKELEKQQSLLLETKEQVQSILNSAGEGIFGVNLEGVTTFINEAGCSILGYKKDELIGAKIHDVIHHSKKDGANNPVEECPMKKAYTENQTFNIDNEVLWKKDGTFIDVQYTSTPIIKGDEITGAVVTFRDISEKLKIEEKIRKSENLLSKALKLAKMGGWEYIPGGSVFWTQEVYEIHGIKPGMIEEFPDKNWIEESANCYQGEDAQRILNAFSETVTKGTPYDLTLRFKPFNGEEKWVRATAEAVVENGEVVRVIGLLSDVDEQKKLEEALVSEKAHLQKILDTSPVGVGISVKGLMKFANPRILELLNMTIGDSAPEVYVNIEDRNYIIETLRKHGIIEDFELQMYGKNKEIKDMLTTYMNITYDGQDAVMGWITDISELKKTDRELREKFDELSRFRKIAVGREIKMIELKNEINILLKKLNKDPKYKIIK